jgi:ApbE superfamily uncharacterized protein (UPF0280 family)
VRQLLPDGRWHFQHGPMDIVIGADPVGPHGPAAVADAHENAWVRFVPLLDNLMQEWPVLRLPVLAHQPCPLQGAVARRMWQACLPWAAQHFITPMAAVAGSVAQALISSFDRPGVARAWINNGGDIALHLTPGQSARVGLYADLARLQPHELSQGLRLDGAFKITHAMPVRGVATSGWRGRSFSLGIADSVTVLAATAAKADAAASMIANAVNVDHPGILRQPAHSLRDMTDLGDLAVTVDVPQLPAKWVQQALQAGWQCARECQAQGLIAAAFLVCQNQSMSVPWDDTVDGKQVSFGNEAMALS